MRPSSFRRTTADALLEEIKVARDSGVKANISKMKGVEVMFSSLSAIPLYSDLSLRSVIMDHTEISRRSPLSGQLKAVLINDRASCGRTSSASTEDLFARTPHHIKEDGAMLSPRLQLESIQVGIENEEPI